VLLTLGRSKLTGGMGLLSRGQIILLNCSYYFHGLSLDCVLEWVYKIVVLLISFKEKLKREEIYKKNRWKAKGMPKLLKLLVAVCFTHSVLTVQVKPRCWSNFTREIMKPVVGIRRTRFTLAFY